MNHTKTTKCALLSSVMAMLICVAMLIGTTFAWFTDSASTAVNKIQAGKLDVGLEMATSWSDGTPVGWDTAEGQTLRWIAADGRGDDMILWEPGCTYNLNQFRIVNNGNLALKYKIVISGIVGDAKLLEAIDFIVTGVDGVATADALNGFEGKLAASSVTDAITISGHMKESAGNEYQGLSIDGIGITVVATQDTVESDSFGNDYDANAEYLYDANAESLVRVSSVSDIEDALAKGIGNIVLASDVTVDTPYLGIRKNVSIDFNGNTLRGSIMSSGNIGDSPNNLVLRDTNNNGGYSIDSEIYGIENGYGQAAAIIASHTTVTIESGKYTNNNAVIQCCQYPFDPNAVGVKINGGTFDGKGAASVIVNVNGNVIVNDGEFNAYSVGERSGACVHVEPYIPYVPSITTINGGTFNADKCLFYVNVGTNHIQKIIVNGGTFNVAEGGNLIQVSSGNASDYLTITGGTFNVDPSAYVDTANYAITHSGSTWTVTAQ